MTNKQYFLYEAISLMLITILIFPIVSFSHDTGVDAFGSRYDDNVLGHPVHQYITTEAGSLWRKVPFELTSHLDGENSIDKACSVSYDSGDDIVTGSAEEDQEWWPFVDPTGVLEAK